MTIQINKYVPISSGQNSAPASAAPQLYLTKNTISDGGVPGDEIGQFFISDRSTEDFTLVTSVNDAFEIINGNLLVVGGAGVPTQGGTYTIIVRAGDLEYEVPIIVVQALDALALSNNSFSVNDPPGTIIGQVLNSTPGSTITVRPADPRVSLLDLNLAVGSTQSTEGPFNITLRETNPGASNSPRDTVIPLLCLGLSPINSVPPVITGDLTIGGTLTSSTGTWFNDPTGFTYQWYSDGVAIVGADENTYELTEDDTDHDISVIVTASNASGDGEAESAPVRIEFVIYAAATVIYGTDPVTYPAGGY